MNYIEPILNTKGAFYNNTLKFPLLIDVALYCTGNFWLDSLVLVLGYSYCTLVLPHYAKEGSMIGFRDFFAELDYESLSFLLVCTLFFHCIL